MLLNDPDNQFPLCLPCYTHLLAAGNKKKANFKRLVKCNLKETFHIHEFQNYLMAAEWDNIHGYKLSTFSQKYASPAKKKKSFY